MISTFHDVAVTHNQDLIGALKGEHQGLFARDWSSNNGQENKNCPKRVES
ncbi:MULTISPECIES: hypothetical protein [unclassified Holdemania]|nr:MULTISPECIES: hypothetical protein [unclassified Holdemania]